ncbi:MAG TPA: DUF3160 domain-containing protein [Armatimonadota bacterium]|nr:DUF3160 domain-containing protein [Armatimonadota bacterium]
MKKYFALVVVVLAVTAIIFASHAKRGTRVAGTGKRAEEVASVEPARNPAGSGFSIPYEPADVKAAVEPYVVKPDLSNVVNRSEFGAFTAGQKALLAKNAFFASPTDELQLFFIYEQNDYKNIPNFITTDSVLQVYHIFYDFTLRNLETEKLYDLLGWLTDDMEKSSRSVAAGMTDPKWKDAAERNRAYFLVASRLMGKKAAPAPANVNSLAAKELQLIAKHERGPRSAIFPYYPDYSQFIPRGHYTRSEKLKRFFKTMMWYGYMPFPAICKMYGEKREPYPWWPQIRQAVLLTVMLYSTKIDGRPAIETWEKIYEPTVFYVGAADDLTPHQYKKIIDKIYGKDPTYAELQDEHKLKQVYAELKKLPEPRIKVALIGMPGGRQFKLMGQRYIPDSEIMQRLVSWPERPFPRGLDVMAVLGSTRAADILDNVYKEPKKWDEYVAERSKLLEEFGATRLATWQSNLYWGWMWGLDSLLDPFGTGYPSFMANQAWADKGLNTSLGSWAELRHDTILYAKQSAMECGGDGEEPPLPKGYVEPNVEFYNRLLWLTKASRAGLDARGLLTNTIREKFGDFEDLLTFLKNVSIKELTNQKLTRAEYDQIRLYGTNLERLTLSVIEGGGSNWYEITSEADKDMAVIADVHTSLGACLEEAVGHANEIYVVVPIEGKLYLTRGAVFSYYEFTHPSSDRLTDEKWQKMLKDKTAAPPPIWIKSFLTGVKQQIPIPRKVRSAGC